MIYINLLTSFILLIRYAYSADTCTSLPVTDQTYECNSPGVFTASQIPNFPISSGATKLTILADIQVLDFCGADRTVSLLQLQYYSASNAKAYNGLDYTLQWTGSSYTANFFSHTPTGNSTLLNYNLGASSSVKNTWYFIAGSVSLSGNSGGLGLSSQTTRTENGGTPSFPTDAIFDSHTLLTLCPNTKCRIRNLQIFYNYFNNFPMDLGVGAFATKIGRYPLNELNGNILNSDVSAMGQAYLGSDKTNPNSATTPAWSTSGLPGLSFTSKSQYVTLPYFAMGESTDTLHPVLISSLTLSIWIKINAFPASGNDYIFRYSDSGLTTDRMAMQVTPAGLIYVTYRGTAQTFSPASLTLSDWTQVTTTFGYYRSPTNAFFFSIVYVAIGKVWGYLAISPSTTAQLNYASSDKILIGGFIGEIGDFSLFSPGSLIRDPPCDPTTCNLDLGFSSPGTCIWKACSAGTYTFMSGCLTCPEGCATCSSAQQCQSCSLGYQLSSNKCVPCPAQTFATASGCVACTVTNCNICSAVSTCYKCNTGFDLYNNQCLTYCGDGKYRDTSDGTCKSCDSKCSKCTTGPTVCQACNSPFVLSSSNQCECAVGSYLDSGTCKTCDSKCSKCTGPAVCQACNSPFVLSSSNQCECSIGTYLDAGTCKSCDSKCSKCTGAAVCQACNSPFVLSSTNQCECSIGSYLDAGTCKTCDSKCSKCTGPAVCQTCNSPFVLSSSNQCECAVGSYLDSGTCKTCDSKCSKCTGLSVCQACNSPFVLSTSNQCECSIGTYLDAGTCKTCDSKCSKCTGLLVCQACNSPFVLDSSNQCECAVGSYLDAGTCKPCDSKCSKCTGLLVCQACNSPFVLSSSNQCECAVGSYLDAGTCKTCDSKCSKCTGLSVCQACNSPFVLSSSNKCECTVGSYLDGATCKPCDSKCSQCTGPTDCQSCNSPFVLSSSNQCECDKGTYLEAGTCKVCDSKCSACTDLVTCTECNSGYDLKSSFCYAQLPVCPKGSYVDSDGTCKPCDSKCSACTNLETCTECEPGHNLENSLCIKPPTTLLAKNDGNLAPWLIFVISASSLAVILGAFYMGYFWRKKRLQKQARKVLPVTESQTPHSQISFSPSSVEETQPDQPDISVSRIQARRMENRRLRLNA